MEYKILNVNSEEDWKILTATSPVIEDIAAESEVIEILKAYLLDNPVDYGVGAPQLGFQKRIFAMRDPLKAKDSIICINPEIVKYYPNKVCTYKEKCLNIPDEEIITRRYKMIKVSFQDESGARHTELLRDENAVIFQHAIDTLNGVILSDRDARIIS